MIECIGQIACSNPDQKPGWYYLRFSDDISRYYYWFARKIGAPQWQLPMNGCHMTFIAGEKDDRIVTMDEMRDLVGCRIEVQYKPVIWTDTRSFWMPSYCTILDDIRKDLGLKPRPSYHITLGNIKANGIERKSPRILGD